MDLREPTLYAPSGDGDAALLLALRDPASGALTFPRSPYGCTRTGKPAAALEEVALSGRATVLTCVTLAQPIIPGLAPPLLVARLRLEEGLVVDGLLDGTEEAAAPPGTRVQAVLVAEEVAGRRMLGCRFRPVAGE